MMEESIFSNVRAVFIKHNLRKNAEHQKDKKFSGTDVDRLLKSLNIGATVEQKRFLQTDLFKANELLNKYIEKKVDDDQTIKNKIDQNREHIVRIQQYFADYQAGGGICDGCGAIDWIQLILDFAGLIPVVGDVLDAVNGVIYLIRGKLLDAILSFIAVIPVIGSVIAIPIKVIRRLSKAKKIRKLKKVDYPDQVPQFDQPDEEQHIEKKSGWLKYPFYAILCSMFSSSAAAGGYLISKTL